MNIGKTIAEYLLPIYQVFEKDSPARKSFLTQALGSFHEFDKTEDFLEKHEANGIDIDKLNKKVEVGSGVLTKALVKPINYVSNNKFNNMLAKFLHDNPHTEDILKKYIEILEQEKLTDKQIDNRIDMIKDLSSIGMLLRADPYNEPQFAKDVLNKVVEWAFDGNKDDRGLKQEIKILRKSLNNFTNKELINEFLNDSEPGKQMAAREVMELINLNHKVQNNKCTILTSTAGFASVGMFGMTYYKENGEQELIKPIIEGLGKIKEMAVNANMTSIPQVTQSLEAIVNSSPWMGSLFAATAIYIGMKAVTESYKKLSEYYGDKQIRYTTPSKYNQACTTSFLCNNQLAPVICKTPYDLTDAQSKQYLMLTSFLMEKASNPMLTISSILENDLNISQAQITKLESLNREDIHELSFVNNFQIKSYLLLNDVNDKEKEIFKKISLIDEIAGISKNHDGNFFKSVSSIANITPNLKSKLNALPANQKKIAECYLNLYRDEKNEVSPSKLKLFENALPNASVFDIVQSEINKFKENAIGKEEENEKSNAIVFFAKRLAGMANSLWGRYVSKVNETEEIKLNNNEIKEELTRINSKHSFTEAEKMNSAYFTPTATAKKIKTSVVDNIMDIRTKALAGTHYAIHKVKSLMP